MDDNLSMKSSESSITTSGEYEIVTDSNVTTPHDVQPSLDIVNNRNISDLQHAMTDALKDLETGHSTNVSPNRNPLSLNQKSMTLPLINSTNSNVMLSELHEVVSNASHFSINNNKMVAHTPKSDDSSSEMNRVGQSVFYDCVDTAIPMAGTKALNVTSKTIKSSIMKGENATGANGCGIDGEDNNDDVDGDIGNGGEDHDIEEKRDVMKMEKNDTDDEISEIDQGCTIFSGVMYLGAANINAPKSELEVYRIMSELSNGSSSVGLKISISIPNSSDGLVVLHDAETNVIIATYEIQSIILYFRGPVETIEHGCFAFTWLHGESLFQCHVFRCHIPEAVNQVSACFQKAFQTYPPSMSGSLTSALDSNMMNSITSDLSGNPLNAAGYEFIVSLEIREKVTKNSYTPVPRDRGCFKLRANTDKEVYITVKQTPSTTLQPLFIERCFGVLLSPGKLVRQGDMQLIDMITMGYHMQQQQLQSTGATTTVSTDGTIVSSTNHTPLCLHPYYIRAEWKASEKAFEQLNIEQAKTFLTVAVDIVIRGIQEPVRFVIETAVAIQSAGDLRLMDHFMSKRPMSLRFYLHLKRTTDEYTWKVDSIDPSEEIMENSQQQQQQQQQIGMQQQSGASAAITTSSSNLLKFGMSNLSRIVRSSSIASIEDGDGCLTDAEDLSDGDEPLLSGTGEVSKDCSQDTLDEWDPILKEWDGDKRPKALASLVRSGIPEALREKIWQKLAGVETKTDMNDMYKILITKETKCETVIQRDIHRTFPAHKCFRESGGSGQDALFKVSKAYAVYDTEVGYCQGLSFIAASLLLHMPEEDAFCVLVALMYDYGLRDLYKQGFEVLYLRLYQLERLMKDQIPKLHEHFAVCGIETHMFASHWFLTLFTARFPLCFVFHVLDVFLLDGIPLLFQVALTLLSICENDLRQLDFEGILKYFRVTIPKKCRSSSQSRRIMKMACERKIKKLKQYEEEFIVKNKDKDRLEKEAQLFESRFGEERRKLQIQIDELQQQLAEANERAVDRERKHTGIIQDYKQIIQRLEQDVSTLSESLTSAMNILEQCKVCAKHLVPNTKDCDAQQTELKSQNKENSSIANNTNNINGSTIMQHNTNTIGQLGPLDPLNIALQRVRELELELAQAKLAQVEAECKNQDLNHQLNTTITEMQANRSSWQPWLSKTLNTLQEKVTIRSGGGSNSSGGGAGNRENPATFQSYMSITGNSSDNNSPSSHQEFKAFSVSNSPKMPTKFHNIIRMRNGIDDDDTNVGGVNGGFRNTLLSLNGGSGKN